MLYDKAWYKVCSSKWKDSYRFQWALNNYQMIYAQILDTVCRMAPCRPCGCQEMICFSMLNEVVFATLLCSLIGLPWSYKLLFLLPHWMFQSLRCQASRMAVHTYASSTGFCQHIFITLGEFPDTFPPVEHFLQTEAILKNVCNQWMKEAMNSVKGNMLFVTE